MRVAADQFYRPYWSEEILNETERALTNQLGVSPRKGRRRIMAMRAAFPDAIVSNLGSYSFGLPDPKDEHVLAAAVRSEAQAIVTFNSDDFPKLICEKENVEVIAPDDFLVSHWGFGRERMRSVIYAQVGALRTPVQGLSNVLLALRPHTPNFVAHLTRSIADDMSDVLAELDL